MNIDLNIHFRVKGHSPSPQVGNWDLFGMMTSGAGQNLSLAHQPLAAWQQFTARRNDIATTLSQLAALIETAEATGSKQSGQLGLDQSIHEIRQAADSLSQGIYRLMVMGDMKRGKSTLINALIGDRLLPSDVNPCTALLTHLRYGPEAHITLHFKGEQQGEQRSPKSISIATFKQDYTIDPDESKRLEAQGQSAFPDIRQVVVEYPLPLLQPGIELIDTPGLNDTEARNDQVLSYLSDCQAVLFVLDATQPLTLDERRYLNNYLKDSGLALFFVVNGWDRIKSGLVDPADAQAVAEAEAGVRAAFRHHLADYLTDDAERSPSAKSDLPPTDSIQAGEPRLFEVSALQALRQGLKGQSLEGSGVSELLSGLDHFLAYERGPTELQRALAIANRAYRSVSTAVARRIPLLDETREDLEAKVASVQSDFGQLETIRDRYCQLIQASSELNARAVSESFSAYVLKLEDTFESDFAASQPDLEFLDFLEADKRQAFHTAFRRAFERYVNDRLAAWEFTAKQTIGTGFDELNASAVEYQVAYTEVVEVIHEKMMGRRFHAVGQDFDPGRAKVWVDSVKDVFEEIPGNLNNAVRPFNSFWQSVMQSAIAYICIVIALQIIGLIFSSLFLNIIGVILAAGGIFAAQAEFVRQEFLKATKQEFAKHLPQIAREQTPHIHRAVKDCFKAYEARAINRINRDIASRQVELTNLVAQKQQHQIDREQEVTRLQQLESQVQANVEAIAATISIRP